MSLYKVNGYDLFEGFGIQPEGDKSTADSIEVINDVQEAEVYQWAEGIREVNVNAPVLDAPRVFVIKGNMTALNMADYLRRRDAINAVFKQGYVTFEQISTGLKANARIKPGSIGWHRMTHLSSGKIWVAVQFKFDELLQPLAYKDQSNFSFTVEPDMDLISTTPSGSIYKFSLDSTGHLILTN